MSTPATPSSSPTAALELRNVHSGYGDTEVLADVSLVVPRNSVTALLGANGAGKTTLLRTISGFVPATKGSIAMFGADVTSSSPIHRVQQGLCHVPEGRGVFPSLTVKENLVLQAAKGREQEAFALAADAFPILGTRMKQTVGTMSGGQQQMVAMAAAYIRKPDLVLIDEASLGLAPVVVDEIFVFLATLVSQGAALLLVDQYVTRVLSMSTGAYVLRQGRIVYSGSSDALTDAELFEHYLGEGGS
jgi:branched-chain amino acid transport system ATP-binding protein